MLQVVLEDHLVLLLMEQLDHQILAMVAVAVVVDKELQEAQVVMVRPVDLVL